MGKIKVWVQIPTYLIEQLSKYAKENKITVSEAVEKILRKELIKEV